MLLTCMFMINCLSNVIAHYMIIKIHYSTCATKFTQPFPRNNKRNKAIMSDHLLVTISHLIVCV